MSNMLPDLQAVVKEAFDEMRSRGKIPNFIFFGGSLLHVAALNAYLERMADKGIEMNGIVVNTISSRRKSQFDSSYVTAIDDESFIYLQQGLDYSESFTHASQVQHLLSTCARLLISAASYDDIFEHANSFLSLLYPAPDFPPFSYWDMAFKENRSIVYVPIEEGVGSYIEFGEQRDNQIYALESGNEAIEPNVVQRVWYGIEKRLNERISQKILIDSMLIFEKGVDGRLIPNRRNAALFRDAFKAIASKKNIEPIDYQDTVIFVATGIYDMMGYVDFEIDLYREPIDYLKRLGVRVILRPHPRSNNIEAYKLLGIDIDQNSNVSIESLLAVSKDKPKALVGMFSSSLATISGIWDVPAISLSGIFDEAIRSADLFPSAHLRQDAFLDAERAFTPIVHSPKTMSEYEILIQKIVGK